MCAHFTNLPAAQSSATAPAGQSDPTEPRACHLDYVLGLPATSHLRSRPDRGICPACQFAPKRLTAQFCRQGSPERRTKSGHFTGGCGVLTGSGLAVRRAVVEPAPIRASTPSGTSAKCGETSPWSCGMHGTWPPISGSRHRRDFLPGKRRSGHLAHGVWACVRSPHLVVATMKPWHGNPTAGHADAFHAPRRPRGLPQMIVDGFAGMRPSDTARSSHPVPTIDR
jgi:hypothetical protein